MCKPRLLPLLCTASALLAPHAALSQDDVRLHRDFDQSPILLANVNARTDAETYLASLVAALRAADLDGNGLDQTDVANIDRAEFERAQAAYQASLERGRAQWRELIGTDATSVTLAELEEALTQFASGRRAAETLFARLDRNQDGAVTQADLSPNPRPMELERFARMDANSDGAISVEELMAATPERLRNVPDAAQIFAQGERNGDGRLAIDELMSLAPPPSIDARASVQRRERFQRLLTIDPDGDGRLTEADLTSAFTAQFSRVDSDGDSSISAAEYANARSLIERSSRMAEARICAVPSPSAEARTLALAALDGQLISTLTLGSQDEVTSIVDLVIEPGRQPLYLMLVAPRPVIWRLSGASERVERVSVFGRDKDEAGNILAGIAGVSESLVDFAAPDCLRTANYNTGENLAATIGSTTGLVAEAYSVSHAAGTISLPSFALSGANGDVPVPEGFDPALWRDALRFEPRGIEVLAPPSVVSKVAVTPYEVMPAAFGVAQLAAQGAIEATDYDSEFRIVRPFPRFPAGLHGAVSVNFVLPDFIPMPAGDQGHACIFSEAGDPIGKNTSCHRAARSEALTVRVRPDGQACLYSQGGTEEACFPEDGRPLVVTETPTGRAIVPAERATAEASAPVAMPRIPEAARSVVEIIPRVRR
jgi:Ca2+-binding EF-hand superfamily protein